MVRNKFQYWNSWFPFNPKPTFPLVFPSSALPAFKCQKLSACSFLSFMFTPWANHTTFERYWKCKYLSPPLSLPWSTLPLPGAQAFVIAPDLLQSSPQENDHISALFRILCSFPVSFRMKAAVSFMAQKSVLFLGPLLRLSFLPPSFCFIKTKHLHLHPIVSGTPPTWPLHLLFLPFSPSPTKWPNDLFLNDPSCGCLLECLHFRQAFHNYPPKTALPHHFLAPSPCFMFFTSHYLIADIY